MSSFAHELLVMLLGTTPHMLRAFLGKRLVASATRVRFRRSDATVSQVPPLGCDLCIELYRGRSTKPFLVLIVEVQLGVNRKKPFSWFAYQACQHYRTRAPALLVVVTNDRKVARWAAGPFCSGQTTLRPLVLGPDDIPAITDPEEAKRSIPLAFVSWHRPWSRSNRGSNWSRLGSRVRRLRRRRARDILGRVLGLAEQGRTKGAGDGATHPRIRELAAS
jgi:hypothetical protein